MTFAKRGKLRLLPWLLLFLCCAASRSEDSLKQRAADPLPQDSGLTGLRQMLVRLHTTARMMQTTAHPDDEDGGMLTLESRGKGASVVLLTLNRGEGGQNKIGSNLFDVLGVLRALELTASDRYYGVEQRFTRVADFGFSKTPEETFQKWQGHDIALGDMVRVIRTFRPDVLAARFSGTGRDGHGHHQASSILTREAFKAAADPTRFPEQIKEGLLPWQVKKLYIGNVCGFGATTCPDADYTLRLNTGKVDPLLGKSYVQFAMDGLRHQLSQGAGAWSVDPGDRFTYYKLVDSVLPPTLDKNGHEQDFFDGIDTSLAGLAARLGSDEAKAPFLRPGLLQIAKEIDDAGARVSEAQSAAAIPLLGASRNLAVLIGQVEKSVLRPVDKDDLLEILSEKQQQAQSAVALALSVSAEASSSSLNRNNESHNEDSVAVISPGQALSVKVTFHNGSKYPIKVEDISLGDHSIPAQKVQAVVQPKQDYSTELRGKVPENHPYTRPYWHRADPERDSINTVDDARYVTLPFPPPDFIAHVRYSLAGKDTEAGATKLEISTPVHVVFQDKNGNSRKWPLAVAPEFSVMLDPGQQVIRAEGDSGCKVKVTVSSNELGTAHGTLRIEVPTGWQVKPASQAIDFQERGQSHDSEFTVFPASLKEGRTEIRAVFESAGKRYQEGYSVVSREDLNTFYYYQPAVQRASIVDVKVPQGLKVGYIMGAGDDIPTVLKQIGMDESLIPAEKIATENLSQYGTIVLGIRAYDTQKPVAENNKKLLEYVSEGGTLVVQYNAGVGDFNQGNFTPYRAQLSRARVSVEDSPIEVLAPDDPIFHWPNAIRPQDFDGWVQERGLYFMDQWDDQFKALLSCHDPGEPGQKGGLLRAQYGKGTYIYTGYAFFRQLPAGVPGAIRLYVNLLSAGHS